MFGILTHLMSNQWQIKPQSLLKRQARHMWWLISIPFAHQISKQMLHLLSIQSYCQGETIEMQRTQWAAFTAYFSTVQYSAFWLSARMHSGKFFYRNDLIQHLASSENFSSDEAAMCLQLLLLKWEMQDVVWTSHMTKHVDCNCVNCEIKWWMFHMLSIYLILYMSYSQVWK